VLAEYQAIERDDYRAAEPDNVSTGCGFGFLGSEAPSVQSLKARTRSELN
jgi:hypothetical protein